MRFAYFQRRCGCVVAFVNSLSIFQSLLFDASFTQVMSFLRWWSFRLGLCRLFFLLGSLFRSSSQRLFACLVCVDRVFCWKSLVASVYGLVSSCSLSLLVCTCSFSQSLWIRLNLLSWLFENSFDKCSWLIQNSANELRMLPKRTRASSWCCGSSRVSSWCCGSGTVAALMGSGFLLLGSVVLLVGLLEPLAKMLPFSEWWRRDQLPRVDVATFLHSVKGKANDSLSMAHVSRRQCSSHSGERCGRQPEYQWCAHCSRFHARNSQNRASQPQKTRRLKLVWFHILAGCNHALSFRAKNDGDNLSELLHFSPISWIRHRGRIRREVKVCAVDRFDCNRAKLQSIQRREQGSTE